MLVLFISARLLFLIHLIFIPLAVVPKDIIFFTLLFTRMKKKEAGAVKTCRNHRIIKSSKNEGTKVVYSLCINF